MNDFTQSSFYQPNKNGGYFSVSESQKEHTNINVNYDLLNSRITEHEEYVSKQKKSLSSSSLPQPSTDINDVIHTNMNPVYSVLEQSSDKNHMVQEKPIQPYIDAFPTDVITGVINPLRKKVFTTNLNIDTRFRDNYYSTTSSNFNINLPMKINKVTSMQLSAIELPVNMYTISKNYNNNFFSITANKTSAIITIPDGNYSAQGLVYVINNELTSLDGYFKNVLFTFDYSNSSSSTQPNTGTQKVIVQINPTYLVTNPAFPLTLNFQTTTTGADDRSTPLPLKFGWLLGFRNGLYINNTIYVTEGIVDLFGPKYVYLCIDDFNNSVSNNFYSAFNSSMLNKNILARITMGPFNILQENDFKLVTTPREYFGPVDIQRMNIQLLDEYGRVLNLNNSDYSFCISFQTVYDI
jgi:hypothetical protein